MSNYVQQVDLIIETCLKEESHLLPLNLLKKYRNLSDDGKLIILRLFQRKDSFIKVSTLNPELYPIKGLKEVKNRFLETNPPESSILKL